MKTLNIVILISKEYFEISVQINSQVFLKITESLKYFESFIYLLERRSIIIVGHL